MEKKSISLLRRWIAALLCLAMLLPLVAMPGYATEGTDGGEIISDEIVTGEIQAEEGEEAGNETKAATTSTAPNAVVYAASDIQWVKSSNSKIDDVDKGEAVMTNIIRTIKNAGYTGSHAVTHAIFCGDYSKNGRDYDNSIDVNKNNAGVQAVGEVLSDPEIGFGITSNLYDNRGDDQVVYVQGNHDPDNTIGLDAFGANDTEHFGVFVLHEDNFPWKQGDSNYSGDSAATVTATANALAAYLEERIANRDNRPVFIAAHIPLHYTIRCKKAWGGDNMHANKIVDVLNRYGDQLTIIYLFGHNHSAIQNGYTGAYDDYLGGAAIYLPAGSKMLVPQGAIDTKAETTIKFTYMNTGYVGPYGGTCETKQSSTVFEIYEDKVVVQRYGETGAVNLKDAGENAVGADNNIDVIGNSDAEATIQMPNTFTLEMPEEALVVKGRDTAVSVTGVAGKSYSVAWTSGDEAIATVAADESDSMKAIITPVSSGTVTITATITEGGAQTNALGDVTVKEMTVTVSETPTVTLATAGEHTFFVFTDHDNNQNPEGDSWKADTSARYFFVSQDRGNPTAGRFMAMQHTGELAPEEGDFMGTGGQSWREVNAEPVNVMELPVEGDNLLVVDTANISDIDMSYITWRFYRADRTYSTGSEDDPHNRFDDNYNWYQIYPSHQSTVGKEDRQSLMLSRGQQSGHDTLTNDPDNDGVRMHKGTKFGWRMISSGYNVGLASIPQYNGDTGRLFAFYYDPIQSDFTTYYIGDQGAGDRDMEMGFRTYLYKEQKITLASDIVAYMTDLDGAVSKGVGMDAGTGDVIYIVSDGETVEVPVTLQMLSGTFDITKVDTYTDLTDTYGG